MQFESLHWFSHHGLERFSIERRKTKTKVITLANTAAKRTAHEYKFKLPVNYAFPVTY